MHVYVCIIYAHKQHTDQSVLKPKNNKKKKNYNIKFKLNLL